MKFFRFRISDSYWGVGCMREKECCRAPGGLVQCVSAPDGDSLVVRENNL